VRCIQATPEACTRGVAYGRRGANCAIENRVRALALARLPDKKCGTESGMRYARNTTMTDCGSFRLVDALGHGGMGVVWNAHHTCSGHNVAVKVLSATFALSPELRAGLVREGRMTARVDNPDVVRVFEQGCPEDSSPYLVLEKVVGEDLGVKLHRDRVLTLPEVTAIVQRTAHALEAVHAAGIVHGDVKPENLVVSAGTDGLQVKLIDFGVARAFDEAPLDADALPFGTPSSMSPEQIRAPSQLSTSWDGWGLSTLTYRALTGRRAFDGDSLASILFASTQGHFLPPSTLRPELSAAVDSVFERAFARDPESRYPTEIAFADALCSAFSAVDAAPRPDSFELGSPPWVVTRRDAQAPSCT
jgi:eukaryotic-like serine/threonine-protein kinase